MKRFIAIPLLVLYLVAVSGTMVQLHFCGSKLSSWNLNKAGASCCCGDEEELAYRKAPVNDDDCCRNKTITLKITQDQHKTGNVWFSLAGMQLALPASGTTFGLPEVATLPVQVKEAYQANAPPGPWQGIPLYKLHSRLTYYG